MEGKKDGPILSPQTEATRAQGVWGKAWDSEATEFNSQLCLPLALWPQASPTTSLAAASSSEGLEVMRFLSLPHGALVRINKVRGAEQMGQAECALSAWGTAATSAGGGAGGLSEARSPRAPAAPAPVNDPRPARAPGRAKRGPCLAFLLLSQEPWARLTCRSGTRDPPLCSRFAHLSDKGRGPASLRSPTLAACTRSRALHAPSAHCRRWDSPLLSQGPAPSFPPAAFAAAQRQEAPCLSPPRPVRRKVGSTGHPPSPRPQPRFALGRMGDLR